MDEKKILELIKVSLERLYDQDQYLICHGEDHYNSERAVVFRFGIYFNQAVENSNLNYTVDVEYSKNIDKIKRIGTKNVIPDLILHERGNNENNVLVMEFKTWWGEGQKHDREKIKQFCKFEGEYKYQYGVTILLGKKLEDIEYRLFTSHKERGPFKWQDLQKHLMKIQ